MQLGRKACNSAAQTDMKTVAQTNRCVQSTVSSRQSPRCDCSIALQHLGLQRSLVGLRLFQLVLQLPHLAARRRCRSLQSRQLSEFCQPSADAFS